MREHLFNQYLTRQACSMVSHHEIFWTVYVSPLGWCPPTKPAYAHTFCLSVHSGNLVFVCVCVEALLCGVFVCVHVCLFIDMYLPYEFVRMSTDQPCPFFLAVSLSALRVSEHLSHLFLLRTGWLLRPAWTRSPDPPLNHPCRPAKVRQFNPELWPHPDWLNSVYQSFLKSREVTLPSLVSDDVI